MRILVDTNILISALLFPNSRVAKTLLYITQFHKVVLCEKNIIELRAVLKRKKPEKLSDVNILLSELSYELIPSSTNIKKKIRDIKDQPILNAAISADVDIILTGDKDFLCLNLKHPRCMNVKDYILFEHLNFWHIIFTLLPNFYSQPIN